MTIPIGTANITPGTTGIFNGPPGTGMKGLLIGNESPYTVTISLQGTASGGTLYPETVDFFPSTSSFNGNVRYTPSQQLANPTSYTAATLFFESVGYNEGINPSSYPMALTRQAVNPTATGKPLFSATVGFGTTATKHQVLNVFNPANSGVTYTFHSVRAFTSSSTAGTRAFIALSTGADLNLSTAVSAVSHTGSSSPPVSTAHCTAWDADTVLTGTDIEDYNTSQNVTVDFLTFPDSYTLLPGNNLRVVMDDASATGNVVRLTMKWTEDSTTTQPTLGVNMSALTAATLLNTSNNAGTGLITATPSGQSGNAISATVDGLWVLQVLQSGVFHQFLKSQASGNPLLLGQSGDTTEVLGNLKADGTLEGVGNATMDGTLTVKGTSSLDNGNISTDGSGNLTVKKTLFPAGSITRVDHQSYTPTDALTHTYNHSLGATPDIVIVQEHGNTTGITWAVTNFTSTTFDMTASGGSHQADILLIKF